MKIQIKTHFSGLKIFEYEGEAITIKDAVRKALRERTALHGADLEGADLEGAIFSGADLRNANFRNANLRDAYLCDANLAGATFDGADLKGVTLGDANLYGADLRGAKNVPNIPLACPTHGEFVGWKKVAGCLIKLLIPEDAKRCSATTRICRCEFAKVLSITRIRDGEEREFIVNDDYAPFVVYRVGEIVKPDSFDEDRWNECSHGIHFFINKQDAIDY